MKHGYELGTDKEARLYYTSADNVKDYGLSAAGVPTRTRSRHKVCSARSDLIVPMRSAGNTTFRCCEPGWRKFPSRGGLRRLFVPNALGERVRLSGLRRCEG